MKQQRRFLTPRAEKLKKDPKFSKSLKIVKSSTKLRVFSDRLFEESHGGGGGGGGGGVGAIVGESAVGVGCLQPLGTTLNTISISLQNSLS